MFNSRKKKQKEQTRRHPVQDTRAGAFSYYSSRRMAMARQNEPERRQILGNKSKKNTALSKESIWRSSGRLGNILLALVLVACVVSILQIDNNPKVIILNKDSNFAVHSTAEYQAAVKDGMRSSLLNGTKITINTRSVVTELKQRFPEVYDASLVLPLVGHRPTVYIELTRPSLLLHTINATVVVDSNGRALTISPKGTSYPNFQLPTITDESNIQLKVADRALSSANVAFIEDVVRQFASQKTTISKMILPAGKEELDVYTAGVSYYVRFNLHDATSRQQAGTFFALKQQLHKQGITPKQYVDVRLTGRAYYL